jgi:hypothetical protein
MAASAAAQTVAIGTTQGGATNQTATAIAAIVTAKSGLQMRPQPHSTTAQYIPLVNAGRLEFGIANVVQTIYAAKGEGMSQGRPNPDLRLVAALFPFEVALFVSAKSGIATLADLKGRSIAHFPDHELGAFVMRGFLANGGVDYAATRHVALPNFPRMWDSFKEGAIDAMIATVGSRPTFEAKATLGDVRALSIDAAPAPMAALARFLPQAYAITAKADPKLPGMPRDISVVALDYTLFAHKAVADNIVAKVAGALYENEAELRKSSEIWHAFEAKAMAKPLGIALHPAAERFYKERGLIK